MVSETSVQYNTIINICRDIFVKKNKDYGTAWRILRLRSITDQIFIKAQRVRSVDEKGISKVDEGVDTEFLGIINYCIIALIQLELGEFSNDESLILDNQLMNLFDKYIQKSKGLMENKNHDYGEAWRDMRLSSFTDLILMKVLRIKQIEDNKGKTIISEGIESNYLDMLNYSVFAMIHLKFGVVTKN